MKIRRTMPDVRMEMTPLMDVVFLLLTFFVMSLTVMIRARVLDVSLPALASGEKAERAASVTVAVRADGSVAVDGEVVTLDLLAQRVRARMKDARGSGPDTGSDEPAGGGGAAAAGPNAEVPVRLLVAADRDGKSQDLLRVLDALAGAGLGDFSLVGAAGDGAAPPPDPARSEDGSPAEDVGPPR